MPRPVPRSGRRRWRIRNGSGSNCARSCASTTTGSGTSRPGRNGARQRGRWRTSPGCRGSSTARGEPERRHGMADDTTVSAFIEIPRGSRNKYEYDEATRTFRLDRVLYSSVHYPTDYGFIPDTLAEDGDHLDILVVVQEPTFPGCLIEAWPLGGLDMHDEKGGDFKVVDRKSVV